MVVHEPNYEVPRVQVTEEQELIVDIWAELSVTKFIVGRVH